MFSFITSKAFFLSPGHFPDSCQLMALHQLITGPRTFFPYRTIRNLTKFVPGQQALRRAAARWALSGAERASWASRPAPRRSCHTPLCNWASGGPTFGSAPRPATPHPTAISPRRHHAGQRDRCQPAAPRRALDVLGACHCPFPRLIHTGSRFHVREARQSICLETTLRVRASRQTPIPSGMWHPPRRRPPAA